MIEDIISAINNRKEISFTYSGLNRIAQPAAVGLSTRGNEVLRCYQTEGGHITSGHEWDLCYLSKISNLQLTGNTFAFNPPGYKRGDRGMQDIFAEL
ncbi:hypothetical protein ACJJIK_02550 [Microbulbifer sp. ZKSA006]|uniref:hypothetical protein n=1 Tax=Microbulbifer sp. ZKSA006 TaxID=3243390 RepID=UPI004039FC3C